MSGIPISSMAAVGAVVVSKPIEKKTIFLSEFDFAIFIASSGDVIILEFPPSVLIEPILEGTLSISPYVTRIMSSLFDSSMALIISLSGHTQTGHPGPGIISRFLGITLLIPEKAIVCS